MNDQINVLIVDDEDELRKSLASVIKSTLPEYNFSIYEAANGKMAVSMIQGQNFDLVLMDVRMPELNGLEALKIIKDHDPKIFVVIMTAHGNLDDAVEAIKRGAFDYIEKPVQPSQVTKMLQKTLETRDIVNEVVLATPIMDDDIDSKLVGHSQKMSEVFDLIRKLSHVDTTVLIRGENGTGKELVAKAIHYNSPRKHGEFIAINCAAIPEDLMESELFGHEKGAFTGAFERKIGKFQLGNKGTIFLDEIAEMKPDMQAKLLRVLQERVFMPVGSTREVKTNARIIAATNQNLEKMIEENTFREDLFYRLNVMPIFLPPLRERIEDLEELIQIFIKKYSKKHHTEAFKVEADALKILKQYKWPGNIRELENFVERTLVVHNSNLLKVSDIPENITNDALNNVNIPMPSDYSGPMDFEQFKEATERDFIINALKANNGKINKTVAHANIPKNTLLRKIKKYNIDVKGLSK
ncbi:MAG: sigma-54-dependent Fis family transcriptional regulator [Bdellovibrionales bacterium]|nr:sigma-54-dependent Fis family transcriptional regulator [Bdellovibrionales bacterium]